MSVSVVVPYHSNRNLLDLCMGTLLATLPPDVEVILVLNNADQREIWGLQWEDPRVKVLRIPRNLGYSKAINAGVAEASGNILVFCDADTFFPYRWFEAIHTFHCDSNLSGLSSCKLVNPSSGRIIDFGMALTQYNNAHPFKDLPVDHPLVQRPRRVQMACSACMMISRDVFLEIGGMDEGLHNFYQDTDLCLRLKAHGGETWVVPDAVVYHQGDSARSNRAPYRADVKGLYYGKNAARMTIDMYDYFRESLDHLKGSWNPAEAYRLVDVATVADHWWHQELLSELFPVIEVHEHFAAVRDETAIDLLNLLPHALLKAEEPLLYFGDRFVALAPNALWHRLRAGRGDVIADRNGNLIRVEDIAPVAAEMRAPAIV